MIVEILFPEVCGLFGDSQNPTYLQATLPNAEFIFTDLSESGRSVISRPFGCRGI